jgi:hypothetical protein
MPGEAAELARRRLERLNGLYMVDLLCDPELETFYSRFGIKPALGMALRNYDRQSGPSN